MSAGDVRIQPPLLGDLIGELEHGGARRLAEIARRVGSEWTEHDVRVGLAALFSDGVAGHNHKIGFGWVA